MKRLLPLLLVAVVFTICAGCVYKNKVIEETTIQSYTTTPIETTQETKPGQSISETPSQTPKNAEITPVLEKISSCSTIPTDLLHLDTPLTEILLIQQDVPRAILAVNGQFRKEVITLDDREYILGISPSGDTVITFKLQNYKDFAGREESIKIVNSNLGVTYNKYTLNDLRSWLVDPTTSSEEIILSWGFAGYWINEDLVYINVGWKPAPDAFTASFIPMIINPYKGTWEYMLFQDLPKLNKHGSVLYSPDLTKVLFTADREVLFDTQSRTVLWEMNTVHLPYLRAFNGAMTGPLNSDWSSNSEYLALVIEHRFFPSMLPEYAGRLIQDILILDKEGNEIIKVRNPYEEKAQLIINGLKWSRDGKQLAFILQYEANNKNEKGVNVLFIYNLEKKAITLECPLHNTLPNTLFKFAWSLTNRYIAVNQINDSPLYVIDLMNRTLIKTDDNSNIIGWSENFGKSSR